MGANEAREWRRFAAEFVSRERESDVENGTKRKGNRATSLPYSPDDLTLIDLLSFLASLSSHAPLISLAIFATETIPK